MRRSIVALSGRTVLLLVLTSVIGAAAFLWPLFVSYNSPLLAAHGHVATWAFTVLIPLLLAVAVAEVRDGILDVKTVALLAILVAIGTVLRVVGSGIIGGEPLFALLILAGRGLGRGFGFLYGATVLLCSALATGFIGPWLPFQMIACAWLGFACGCLPTVSERAEKFLLAGVGAVAALCYGSLLDLWFWPFQTGLSSGISFLPGGSVALNLSHFFVFDLTTSLGFDLLQAGTNVALLLVFATPVLRALDRMARRAAFGVSATFLPPTSER
jgi:energy-coupling factor transport system substrate-specific component